ncbi:MAG: hypothetical protein K1X57_10335 [Gemmataceae bacterium]|nr:hypothetical protein [Gemmataceae bacterium]
MTPIPASLCETCRHLREVTSGRGSRFLLCQVGLARDDWPKYPPQPVARCSEYQQADKPESTVDQPE